MTYLLIALFSFWFVELTRTPFKFSTWLKDKRILYKVYEDEGFRVHYERRIKPLDCSLCLSFWLALGYSLATDPTFYSPLYAGLTSLLAVWASLFTNKYLR